MSELESAVLGVIWQMEPCSAYTVAKEFAPVTSGWSASAGSIYPVVARLYRLGFIRREEQPWGRGRKHLYQMTDRGQQELRAWITNVPRWAGTVPADPIRTRSFFLGALNGRHEMDRFVQLSVRYTSEALRAIENDIEALSEESDYERLGLLGAQLQLKAKLEWLAHVENLAVLGKTKAKTEHEI